MQLENKDPVLRKIAEEVRDARRRRGLSQTRAAEQLEIDYRHYQNIEGAKINMRLDTFIKLSHFYDLKIDLHSLGGVQ